MHVSKFTNHAIGGYLSINITNKFQGYRYSRTWDGIWIFKHDYRQDAVVIAILSGHI